MNSIERIICTFEGQPVDRIPTFCAGMEDRTYNDVLGKPLISQQFFFRNPFIVFLLDRWAPRLTRPLLQPLINKTLGKRIKASIKLGFDATWAVYDESFVFLDSKTMVRFSGGKFNLVDDGFGNVAYQYRGPGITSREEFEAWPYWPDPDTLAHRTYTFFRKMMRKYGNQICFFGMSSVYGMHESMMWALGIEQMSLWIMKERDLVQQYINRVTSLCLKTVDAMLDAGVPIILLSDDFAYKSGPFFNPKLIDELFGPSYRQIIKAVHDRGGKVVLHSCGDNTLLFDTFIRWGFDGLHAYETTSNVDIYKEKEIHGQQTVIIGGMGIDYLLTDRSKDEEVTEEVKKLVAGLGPGGKYILAPSHSMSSIPGRKLEVMIDAVRRFGMLSQ
jgi:hypothetical protein